MGRYFDNLKALLKGDTDAAQDAKLTALLTQGSSDPSTKPSSKNLLYFNTTSKELFVSTGTSASTDWKAVKAVAISNG